MTHSLPALPFSHDALAPIISAETLSFHHGKHHQAYVTNLNKLIEGTEYAPLSLEEIIERSRHQHASIFNNAAQHWNHSFYWLSLRAPKNNNQPQAALLSAITARWGSFEAFQAAFEQSGLGQFGSGWTWLIKTTQGLEIVNTSNAELPQGSTPLFVVDVWEHAYYIDHRNNRGAYLKAFWQILNWSFAESRFAA